MLWLWYRLAAAALIPPLALELPYTTVATLKKKKRKRKKKERERERKLKAKSMYKVSCS